MTVVFETERLFIRRATAGDALLIHELWTNPDVMENVGYPRGLPVTLDDVQARIAQSTGVLDALLIVERKNGAPIGQCLAGRPGVDGIATTDIKLVPAYWGKRYGVEVKQGLLDYLFTHTDCTAVEATPNVGNVASIRMQEAVGGIRVGEDVSPAPVPGAIPVHHAVYRVTRETWRRRHADPG